MPMFAVQDVSSPPFVGLEEQGCIQLRAVASHAHEERNAPGHHHVQRQCALNALDPRQLQGFHPAAVLEDMEIELDFPARPVPVNKRTCLVILEVARPHPGIEQAQRFALRRHCIGRVQVHAALRPIGQRQSPDR